MSNVLSESTVKSDPIEQFRIWYAEAEQAKVPAPEAMTLATATRNGKPSAHTMLLRGADRAALPFSRITGAEREATSTAIREPRCFSTGNHCSGKCASRGGWSAFQQESDTYFQSRPHGHQLGAWASNQDEVLAGREVLEQRMQEVMARYGDGPVPRPPHWGGYRVRPDVIEFWQGQKNRLHDRIEYARQADGSWKIRRLSP